MSLKTQPSVSFGKLSFCFYDRVPIEFVVIMVDLIRCIVAEFLEN